MKRSGCFTGTSRTRTSALPGSVSREKERLTHEYISTENGPLPDSVSRETERCSSSALQRETRGPAGDLFHVKQSPPRGPRPDAELDLGASRRPARRRHSAVAPDVCRSVTSQIEPRCTFQARGVRQSHRELRVETVPPTHTPRRHHPRDGAPRDSDRRSGSGRPRSRPGPFHMKQIPWPRRSDPGAQSAVHVAGGHGRGTPRIELRRANLQSAPAATGDEWMTFALSEIRLTRHRADESDRAVRSDPGGRMT